MQASPPSIYRSAAGKAEVMALYESRLAHLPAPCHSSMVKTRFGLTHVVVTGPEEAPPLLILAGVNAGAPLMLEMFWTLTHDFRIYAPDTIGQPGRSAETRPPASHRNYGKWVVDVLDGLGLKSLAFLGISFGAGILLDTAAFAPERITQAVLVVPTGIVKGPFLRVAARLFLPWFLYRLFPSRKRLRRAVRPIMEPDEELLKFFDVVLRNVKFAVTPPGPFTREELQNFRAPTLALLAKDDIFIPADEALSRAKEIIPNLKSIEVFEGPHIPTDLARKQISERIQRFLKEHR